MITFKIQTSKIDKSLMFKGKDREDGTKGEVYLDGIFSEYKDGPNERNEKGYITQSVSKEQREKGIKGPIIGNWKEIEVGGKKNTPPPAARPAPTKTPSRPAPPPQNNFDDSDTPF